MSPFSPFFKPNNKRKKSSLVSASPTLNGFKYLAPISTATPSNWGTWLQSQPAPSFKPGHRLAPLTVYLYGSRQEYNLSLDLAERWGYVLNVGYGRDYAATIADAKTASPTTSDGKLLKKAILEPTKYPVSGVVTQQYPNNVQAPEGYLRDANGVVVGDWSPEATPAAMLIAVNQKMESLRSLVTTGVNIPVIYDGGEAGLNVAGENAQTRYGVDPRVIAAKGTQDWADYISKRKGDQTKLVANAVSALLPNRKVYGFYPALARPYANIQGATLSDFDYKYMQYSCDMPTGSVYYKDFFASGAGMTNPAIRDRAYYDQLTHFLAAVGDQILTYNKPLSYNFVSAGYKHQPHVFNDGSINPAFAPEPAGVPNPFFLSIDSYKGFLKCMYAAGMIGGVAGYFSPDCAVDENVYTPYDATKVPHWLLQQQALSEIQARFSWLEDYIYDGDLLQGDKQHVFKTYLPAYEYKAYTTIQGFETTRSDIRVLARKLRTSNRWLVVLCTAEKTDGSPGDDTLVTVKGIVGLGEITLNSRGKGSIYTIDTTNGSTIVTLQDP